MHCCKGNYQTTQHLIWVLLLMYTHTQTHTACWLLVYNDGCEALQTAGVWPAAVGVPNCDLMVRECVCLCACLSFLYCLSYFCFVNISVGLGLGFSFDIYFTENYFNYTCSVLFFWKMKLFACHMTRWFQCTSCKLASNGFSVIPFLNVYEADS